MQQHTKLLAAALAFAAVSACASLGTPEDQSAGASLWREIADHQEWGQFEKHPGRQRGKRPHGTFVASYINDIAAGDQTNPPMGSVIVKESYSSEGQALPNNLTVMKRIEGYDPDNGDWFWARFDADGALTHSGKVGMCADCHFDAGNDDFVFLND
ncbi:MAG: hypothetical protein ACI8QC_002218 [Planctomycetota bacterium]|jgi:hypothetical protein